MIIISYDIENDKLRNKFSKYIRKFGFRLQYSVYQIDNCDRILNNIISDITFKFEKMFGQSDSVIIFQINNKCKIIKFGYAQNLDSDFIIVD